MTKFYEEYDTLVSQGEINAVIGSFGIQSELKYGTWKGKLKAAPEVSILDPVLAEIACKWFCVEKGRTFDCFAGDTVFGYVSGDLGHDFTGIELRKEQAAINNERVRDMSARYICDDGQNVSKHIKKIKMYSTFM